MGNGNDLKEPSETAIKLYSLLVDQIQKHTTVLWQFPVALLAADAFALDKLAEKPLAMFLVGLSNFALAYSFLRLVMQQRCIIDATKLVEKDWQSGFYKTYIPNFSSVPRPLRASVWLSVMLFAWSAIIIAIPIWPIIKPVIHQWTGT